MAFFTSLAGIQTPNGLLNDSPSEIDVAQKDVSTKAMKAVKTSRKKWLLIDGALLPQAHDTVLTDFVHRYEGIQYRNVFVGTQWHDIADVGPMLVSYHPDIEAWAQAQQPWRFGLVFESSASLATLSQHWLRLSDCQHRGLEGTLCRLYDGIVLYHLLQQGNEERQASWLGPMEKVWLPDYVSQHYFYAKRPELEPLPTLEQVAFTDPEWQSLSDAKRYYAAHRLTQHMETYFPEYWLDKGLDNVDKHAHIIEQLTLLIPLGEVTQQGATYYMNLLGRLGNIWAKGNPHQEIVKLLKDTSSPLSERLEKANQLALQQPLSQSANKEVTT